MRKNEIDRCPHCMIKHLSFKMLVLDIALCTAMIGSILGDYLSFPLSKIFFWLSLTALGVAGRVRTLFWEKLKW